MNFRPSQSPCAKPVCHWAIKKCRERKELYRSVRSGPNKTRYQSIRFTTLNEKPEQRETSRGKILWRAGKLKSCTSVLLTFSFHISCKVQQLLVLALWYWPHSHQYWHHMITSFGRLLLSSCSSWIDRENLLKYANLTSGWPLRQGICRTRDLVPAKAIESVVVFGYGFSAAFQPEPPRLWSEPNNQQMRHSLIACNSSSWRCASPENSAKNNIAS